ncbi:hypothetical protein WJX73_002453 [Symbiochloris irregularis]|uniref:Glutathione S-transferase n=1 Tax=Symbiochloris irregularis TaxID=706552 RepID=A0AAW1NN12_9CHLO
MASANRILFWGSGSAPAWRVQVLLKEKKLDFTSKQVEFSKNGHKSEEIIKLNPRGQVPTFKDGETVVNESIAALLYLEKAYPKPSFLPEKTAPEVLQRTLESNNLQLQLVKVLTTKEDDPAYSEVVTKLKTEFGYWEQYLSKSKFLAGDELTLADIAAGPFFLVYERQGATFKDYPKVAAYIANLKQIPSFKETFPPHWADTPSPNKLKDRL